MSDLLQLIFSGVAVGMIYSLLAFGYNITFATSRTINFAQGEILMLGALCGLSLTTGLGLPYWLALPGAGLLGALLGVLVERVAVRPALKTGSAVSWILATVAFGIVARNVAERLWGTDDTRFPGPLGDNPVVFGLIRFVPQEVLVIAAAAVIMLGFEAFRRYSVLGKAVTAAASDKDAAQLMGINVSRVITLSFALSAGIAAVAGVLVAPLTLAGATMGTLLGTKAYAVAIIGGLQSGLGVLAGGLILGLSEQFTARYLSTGYKDAPGFIFLILILMIRPVGLFGKKGVTKV